MGGQAEYVRVPYGDVNLLRLPDDVPDEKGLSQRRAGDKLELCRGYRGGEG